MLKELVEKKHFKFAKEASNWKEAIAMSCEVLELDNSIEKNYKEEIIKCIELYGPYIVIMPLVAIPHYKLNNKVKKTEVAFMKLEKPVNFIDNNTEKPVQIFFTIASCNANEHLNNISRLSEILMNENIVNKLLEAKSKKTLML